ncbi:hypothetical protein ABPG75_006194 [Micractinium tetrahymenae]
MQAAAAEPLALVAPLVLPLDAGGTAYEGYLLSNVQRAAGRPARLWLRLSGLRAGAPSLAGARLEVNAELAALLQGGGDAGAVLAQRLAEAPSLPAFMVELQNMVDTLSLERAAAAAATAAARPAAFYASLKAELDLLGWRHVAALSDDLSSLTLAATDAAGRRHELRLALPPGYPAAPPIPLADLPTALEMRWGPGSGLAAALRQFEAALEQHQQLWDSLDDLDAHAWVIEPSAPPRSALHRRIALGSHVSLALTLDPAQPGALPTDCRFMGSDAAVAPLRKVQRLHSRGRRVPCSAASALRPAHGSKCRSWRRLSGSQPAPCCSFVGREVKQLNQHLQGGHMAGFEALSEQQFAAVSEQAQAAVVLFGKCSKASTYGTTPSLCSNPSCPLPSAVSAPSTCLQAEAVRQPGAVAGGPHPAGEPGGGAAAAPAAAAGRRLRGRVGRLRHLLRLPPAAGGGPGGGGGSSRGRARGHPRHKLRQCCLRQAVPQALPRGVAQLGCQHAAVVQHAVWLLPLLLGAHHSQDWLTRERGSALAGSPGMALSM